MMKDHRMKRTLSVLIFVSVLLPAFLIMFTINEVSLHGNLNVYAATSLESAKAKNLKNLKKVYSYYRESYYTSGDYKNLTDIYNSAIEEINKCDDSSDLKMIYNEYKSRLKEIKPSVLVKYQKKQEKSLLKAYKQLIKENDYSDYNLQNLNLAKEQGIEDIYNAKTKTKSKKAKANGINSMKAIATILDETKNKVIEDITNNTNLSSSEKSSLIEQINNMDNVDSVITIGNEYGSENNDVKTDDTEVVTLDQINERVKKLVKKYPAYTETQIRHLVAAANMDFIKSEDIYSAFGANSKSDFNDIQEEIDGILESMVNTCKIKKSIIYFNGKQRSYLDNVEYEKMLWPNELYINAKFRIHADYLCELTKSMIIDSTTEDNYLTTGTEGTVSTYKAMMYIYDFNGISGVYYDDSKTISINDKQLNKTSGAIISTFFVNSLIYAKDIRYDQFYPSKDSVKLDERADEILEKYNNIIVKQISNKQKVK
ncbi:MAG: hypothetical protein K6E85_10140 [Lachnospiraceae bacterium]|nr:hypothetical protein [Lachnospiraceae bacterium]